jgi:uncharacterized protein
MIMRKHPLLNGRSLAAAALAALLVAGCGADAPEASADGEVQQQARSRYTFAGGPSGGTFQYYASAISTLAGRSDVINARVLARATAGSVENIRLVNSGEADFGLAYSGHVYEALHGRLEGDTRTYEDVRAVAYLYGAPAQLIVRRGINVTDPLQLRDKRVALGDAGSGAAYNAELFFKSIGIFDQMRKEYLGYRNAASALSNRQIDGFWVFAGFPNASVMEAAMQGDVVLLDIYPAAQRAGMFEEHPYMEPVTIPAGTYQGQTRDVQTFQDATILVANASVPDDMIYKLLSETFSEAGLAHMVATHQSATEMSIAGGTRGIVTPFHPGAARFWSEKGVRMAEPRRVAAR